MNLPSKFKQLLQVETKNFAYHYHLSSSSLLSKAKEFWKKERLMSAIAFQRPGLLRSPCNGFRISNELQRISSSWKMSMDSSSSQTRKREELLRTVQGNPCPQTGGSLNLQFDRLQLPEQAFLQSNRIEFGSFVAREALLDEEYWTAAWLRAETHWEGRSNERYVDNYKRKFAEQEFNALKRRCIAQLGQKSTCVVAVKEDEKNLYRSVLKSVVGTLDLSIGYLSNGEKYPGERVKSSVFYNMNKEASNRYGYIANLCVAKSARRQGIARNMLAFAVRSAKSDAGAEQVFVHVHRNNMPARQLYEKMGFEVVEIANSQLFAEQIHLLRLGV